MNSESKPKIQRTQASKSASYKRVHRANHPVLVTAETDLATEQAIEEAMQPATQVAVEEYPAVEQQAPRRRMPAFFTSIGRSNKATPEADQRVARLARATRGKIARSTQEEEAELTKKPVKSGATTKAAPPRPRSMFKMRYILGMMLYVIIAEYLGTFLQAWMRSQHMDTLLFQWGAFQFTTSTLLFLAILVVILVILAKLDLIPTSLRKMMNSDVLAPRGSTATASKRQGEPTFETGTPRPTVRQGVKGEHDDLYQAYRSNQRYFQKKDRKR